MSPVFIFRACVVMLLCAAASGQLGTPRRGVEPGPPPAVLLELTRGLSCLLADGDDSRFADSLLAALVRRSPTILKPRQRLDVNKCPALVLAARRLDTLPRPDLPRLLSPKDVVVVVTEHTSHLKHAHEQLYQYRRTRFIWISKSQNNLEYYAFLNMTSFVPVERDEVYRIYRKIKPSKKLKNFGGAKFRIAAINSTVYSQISSPEPDGKLSWATGFELGLLQSLCRRLGLEPEVYTLPDGRTYDWLFPNGSLKTPGMQYEVRNWLADAATGNIWLLPDLVGYHDFLSSWEQGCYRYLVPRPRRVVFNWLVFVFIFGPWVWILILSADVTVALLLTLVTRISPNPNVKKGGRQSFWSWLFKCSFTLLLVSFPRRPRGAVVPLVAGWVWTSFVLVAAFQAELNTGLVFTELEDKVDGPEGFLRKGYTWGHVVYNHDDPTSSSEFDSEDSPTWRKWTYGRFRAERAPEDRERRMARRDYVVPGASIGRYFFFLQLPPPSQRVVNRYEAGGACYQHYFPVTPLPYGSPYTSYLNRVLSRLRAGGLLRPWGLKLLSTHPALKQYVARNVFTPTRELVRRRKRPLSLGTTAAAFCLLLAGHLLAGLAFVAELHFHRRASANQRSGLLMLLHDGLFK